jgi:hypothetical protein
VWGAGVLRGGGAGGGGGVDGVCVTFRRGGDDLFYSVLGKSLRNQGRANSN